MNVYGNICMKAHLTPIFRLFQYWTFYCFIHFVALCPQVYKLLFGTDLKTTPRHTLVRVRRSLPDLDPTRFDKEESVQQLKAVMNTVVDHIPSVKKGLLYKMVKSGEIQREEEVMRLIPSLLGLLDSDDNVDPQSMAELLKVIICFRLSPFRSFALQKTFFCLCVLSHIFTKKEGMINLGSFRRLFAAFILMKFYD